MHVRSLDIRQLFLGEYAFGFAPVSLPAPFFLVRVTDMQLPIAQKLSVHISDGRIAAIKISGGVNIDGETTWVNSAEYTTTTSTYVNTVV